MTRRTYRHIKDRQVRPSQTRSFYPHRPATLALTTMTRRSRLFFHLAVLATTLLVFPGPSLTAPAKSTVEAFLGPLPDDQSPKIVFDHRGTKINMIFGPNGLESFFKSMCDNTMQGFEVEYFKYTDSNSHPAATGIKNKVKGAITPVDRSRDVTYKCSGFSSELHLGYVNCQREASTTPKNDGDLDFNQSSLCDFRCITVKWEGNPMFVGFGRATGDNQRGKFCIGSFEDGSKLGGNGANGDGNSKSSKGKDGKMDHSSLDNNKNGRIDITGDHTGNVEDREGGKAIIDAGSEQDGNADDNGQEKNGNGKGSHEDSGIVDGTGGFNNTDGNVGGKTDGKIDENNDGNIDGNNDGNVDGDNNDNVDDNTVGYVDDNNNGNVDNNKDGNVDGNTDGNVDGNTDGDVDYNNNHNVDDNNNNNDDNDNNGNVDDNNNGNVDDNNNSDVNGSADDKVDDNNDGNVDDNNNGNADGSAGSKADANNEGSNSDGNADSSKTVGSTTVSVDNNDDDYVGGRENGGGIGAEFEAQNGTYLSTELILLVIGLAISVLLNIVLFVLYCSGICCGRRHHKQQRDVEPFDGGVKQRQQTQGIDNFMYQDFDNKALRVMNCMAEEGLGDTPGNLSDPGNGENQNAQRMIRSLPRLSSFSESTPVHKNSKTVSDDYSIYYSSVDESGEASTSILRNSQESCPKETYSSLIKEQRPRLNTPLEDSTIQHPAHTTTANVTPYMTSFPDGTETGPGLSFVTGTSQPSLPAWNTGACLPKNESSTDLVGAPQTQEPTNIYNMPRMSSPPQENLYSYIPAADERSSDDRQSQLYKYPVYGREISDKGGDQQHLIYDTIPDFPGRRG